jgi:two-component system OmpR family sensor kinase
MLVFGLSGTAGTYLVVRGATNRIESAHDAALQVAKQATAAKAGTSVAGTGREPDADELALRGIVPVALSIVLLSIASALIVWRGLRPLDALRSFATSIDPENPTPAQYEDAPSEFGCVIDLINQLVKRLVEVREAEKRLTRNTAHALRTPIAALCVQAANLGNGPETQRGERLAELQQGVNRLASLGSQLVTLANAEEVASGDMITEVALRRVVYDVVAALFPFAVERDIDLGAGHIDDVKVRAAEPDLRQLLMNVVDNAIATNASAKKTV